MINSENSRCLSGRAFDPTGRVYLQGDEIFRVVYPQAADRVRKMFASGLVARLVERGLLVSTEIKEEGDELVLKHERARFLTGAHEWPFTCLRDAALVWVELNLELLEHGLGCVDAHPANFTQIHDCAPVWLDFGSIAPLKDGQAGLAEFRRFFLNPLRLMARSAPLTNVVRTLLRHQGLSDYEWWSLRCAALGPIGRKLQGGVDTIRRWWTRQAPKPAADGLIESRRPELLAARDFLESWVPAKTRSFWGNYQVADGANAVEFKEEDPRQKKISEVIESLHPATLIDLASNAGRYSFRAASFGVDVLALDFDENAVAHLYQLARKQSLGHRIACGCANVMHVPYERSGIARQADLVLALALTHHLALGQGFSWEMISTALTRYSSEALLVEYMPNGLSPKGPPKKPLPDSYAREHFLTALKKHFTEVEVVAEFRHASPRDLILCRGKRR